MSTILDLPTIGVQSEEGSSMRLLDLSSTLPPSSGGYVSRGFGEGPRDAAAGFRSFGALGVCGGLEVARRERGGETEGAPHRLADTAVSEARLALGDIRDESMVNTCGLDS
jgi:hypothetical protein